jgi:hypothetical protein
MQAATTTTTSTTTYDSTTTIGPRLAINEDYPGLSKIHSNPDIFVIEQFLDDDHCQDLIDRALDKTLERSPVAYAGWTDDFKDLVELAAKGPVAWIALLGAWVQVKDDAIDSQPQQQQVDLVIHALQNYAIVFVMVTALIAAFTYSRAESLKGLRTSTSTTLDDWNSSTGAPSKRSGIRQFIQNAAILFSSCDNDDNIGSHDRQFSSLQQEAALFEAPTVIRYEPGQVLAPHYDANRSAETEDANRGGQTLATLLVYLNDVQEGGRTRFGKLPSGGGALTVQPKRGDALLFFPADRAGNFDPRTEHEGMPAIDEKWIARIWRHKQRVPPPFGLSDSVLEKLS